MMTVDFGGLLLRLRSMRAVTQTALAEAAGLNRATIRNIEGGAPCRMGTAITLLRALDPPLTDQERAETSKILGIHPESLVFASPMREISVEDRMVAMILRQLGPEAAARVSLDAPTPPPASPDASCPVPGASPSPTIRSIETIVRELIAEVGAEHAETLLASLIAAIKARPAGSAEGKRPAEGHEGTRQEATGNRPLRLEHVPLQKRTPDGKPYVEQQITEAERLAAERAASRRAKPLPRDNKGG
jgi:DNA-binding XRE family transcriptional regulator